MLSTVSPVMVGADAASPHPTMPLSASIRTSTLSARAIWTPAMMTGFVIGRFTAIGSMCLIFTLTSKVLLDHFFAAQFRDCFWVEPKVLNENFIRVLTERRWRAPHRGRRVREFKWNTQHLQFADQRVFRGLDHVPRGGVRIVKRLCDSIDAAAGDGRRLELLDPRPTIGGLDRARDEVVDQVAVLDPRPIGRKARILRPIRMAEDRSATRELGVVADRERNHAVRGLVGRIGHDTWVAVAEPASALARRQIARGDIDQHRQ